MVQLSEAIGAVDFIGPRIEVQQETGCWQWLGTRSKTYGQVSINGRMTLIHRWAFENIGGHNLPKDWEVDHQGCPSTLCCNPAHLQAVTQEEHRTITNKRREQLRATGPDWEWTPSIAVRNLHELAATIRLDDGRAAPKGAGIQPR